MLETKNLTKAFKKKTVVSEVNIYLEKGESVGLLGPNGAGKSTTISMISTLLPPTSGEVWFNGQNALKESQGLRKVMGVVPQEIALYEELSAYENMKFFGKVYGLRGKELESRITHVLDLIGLTDRKKDAVNTYSGGMKRRINIGVTLLHEPEILIMDEPTVGIDPQSRNYILDMIKTLNKEKGITVLYTSHYMEEVEKLCDRVYIMDHGEIIASGTNEELKSILSNEETIQIDVHTLSMGFQDNLLHHSSIRKVTEEGLGYRVIAPKGEDLLSEVFELAKQTHTKITGVSIQTPSLEDVFLHLTGRKLRD
ncbi:ABC transporter ATP-binding protein [Alkalibacterium olivapovliticus]|uniref:ABC-2 type transport system ATP-binding protein n=1 Tax=Alkalibacterium olivapovliticus TaxID=99907 RepID=A0A2T0W749_9LACT|nr:ABC transporter ATP-binding protein [Alkalibacterium olivapovliticus]PRY82522.1 ABC-2 type transport system ATP-binding protein [Alkalibacterium olivapovliticus]